MDFLIFAAVCILSVCVVVLFRRTKRLEQSIDELLSRDDAYQVDNYPQESEIVEEIINKSESEDHFEEKAYKEDAEEPALNEIESAEKTETVSTDKNEDSDTEIINLPPSHIQSSDLWKKIEGQLAANWTGILGILILVLGIAFLGVYTALKMNEFSRFVMIVLVSLGFLFGYLLLKKYDKWFRLALWLRSASGALFLFACVGAAGIPGLQWIENQMAGLALLLFGIAVNLFIAITGGRQLFASLHVLLSLAALAAAPQNTLMLIIASVVALCGIALAYREQWELNLLTAISSFFLFHLNWVFALGGRGNLAFMQEVWGIVLVCIICTSAALVHYQHLYSRRGFQKIPFAVHLVNWLYFALALLLHSAETPYKSIPIFLGSAAAFALAYYARKIKIHWLYSTDVLIAQVIFLAALYSLTDWNVGLDVIVLLMLFSLLIFTRIIALSQDLIVYRFGLAMIQVLTVVLLLAIIDSYVQNQLQSFVMCLGAASGLALFGFLMNDSKNRELLLYDTPLALFEFRKHEFSITQLLAGVFLIAASIIAYESLSYHFVLTVFLFLLLITRNLRPGRGFTFALCGGIAFFHLASWIFFADVESLKASEIFLFAMPLYLLSFGVILLNRMPGKKRLSWFGVYLAVSHTVIASYFLLKPYSPVYVGLLWLGLSIILLEISRYIFKHREEALPLASHLMISGIALLLLFLLRYIFVYIEIEEVLGPLKVRYIAEAAYILVLAYWVAARPKLSAAFYIVQKAYTLLLELLVVFSVLTAFVELDPLWYALTCSVFSFLLLAFGTKEKEEFWRLSLYSVLLYVLSIILNMYHLGSFEQGARFWLDATWLAGSVALALQFAYLVVVVKYSLLQAASEKLPDFAWVFKLQNILLFYPLAISTGFYLYWSFSSQLLTFMWILECFVLFVIGLVLKERHFRYTSLAGVIICVIRLIFFDLAQAATLYRALVFVGVGLIMLAIHVLYTKYKSRFE